MKRKQKMLAIASLVIIILYGCGAAKPNANLMRKYKGRPDKIVVTGHVFDADNNNRILPGVGIKDTDTLLLGKTDEKGVYHVEPKAGRLILRTSYIGYRSVSSKLLHLVPGDSVVVNFKLKESNESTSN